MSEALDALKAIGVQKIHQKTHIPLEHIESLLKKDYGSLSKVQFLGFVSILERDFALDLGSLRLAGVAYFDEKRKSMKDDGVFIPQPKKQKFTSFYILLGAIIVAFVLFANLDESSELETPPPVDNSLIMDVKKNIEVANEQNSTNTDANLSALDANATLSDENSSLESNQTQELNATEEVVRSIPEVPQTQLPTKALTGEKSLVIKTKTKLWLGYIDLETNEHFQKAFTGEFALDAQKDWLLYFGHRFATIVVDGEETSFKESQNVRYLFKDGVLSSLSAEEFTRLNRGKEW